MFRKIAHRWHSPTIIATEKAHLSHILSLILQTMLVAGFFVGLSRLMAGYYLTALLLFVGTAINGLCLWLNWRGHLNAASTIILLTLVALVALLQIFGQGMHDIAIIIYPIIAIIASLLLDRVFYFSLILLTLVAIAFVTYLDMLGLTHSDARFLTDSADFFIVSTVFLITAVAMRQIANDWQKNLDRARRSEQELAQKAHDLQISEDHYRSIFENSPISLWENDFSGIKAYLDNLPHHSPDDLVKHLLDDPSATLECVRRIIILNVNQATLDLFQAASQPQLVAHIELIFGANTVNLLRQAIIALIKDETPFTQEIALRTLQGEFLTIIYRLVVAPENKTNWARVFVSVQDITAQKTTQRALEMSQVQALSFQQKLHNLHDVSIELSRALTLEDLYRQVIELGRERLGFDRLELTLWDADQAKMVGTYSTTADGRLRNDADHPPQQPSTEMHDILSQKKRLGFWRDVPLLDEGVPIGIGWRAMSVLWNGDEGIGWLTADNHIRQQPPNQQQLDLLVLYGTTVGHFITLKQIESDREALIRELETKNAELERFTYTVSHDLKSPLVTVQGFLGYLEQDALSGNIPQLQKDIQHIREASLHMQALLNDLLELSRIGRLINQPQTVSFNELTTEALKQVSGIIAQQDVTVVIQPNMPSVHVDRARLIEVLQNLLDNAAKFMGDQPHPRINVGCRQAADKDVFFVRDNGIGIDKQYHDKVFGLFERLDSAVEGTGIGLALVKRIIEVHNGRIWIENNTDHVGTTFCFTLGPAPAQTH